MLFNSLEFLLFFPVVLLIYYVIPNKIKYIWLLISSYYFYMCWNAEYALLILTSTVVTYLSGLFIERIKNSKNEENAKTKYKKYIVTLSFSINLAILFYFKYSNFTLSLVGDFFSKTGVSLNVPQFDIILPVGISFYTFQALSYTMDVYRDEIYAERNFFKYALFVSFFPQLVAGPIERSKNLLKQLAIPKKFSYDGVKEGVYLMLWGYFLKTVLADRIAIFVDTVYGNYTTYPGTYLVVATVLFAIQIYCDFAGYSTVAMGASKILGIQLMENFDAPYFATTVAGFWRRWHISLTSWFKDYLYIPLGGSRKGKIRKQINKIIVFFVSGLWHGADLSYVLWGGLNGFYQVVGEMIMPVRNRVVSVLSLNRNSVGHKLAKVVVTFILVDFSWIFFRAKSISDAIEIVISMFTVKNPWIIFDGSLYNCGLNSKNFWLMIAGIVILFLADYWKNKGIVVRRVILEQDFWFRLVIIETAIFVLLVFGVWGSMYDAANFIYFQF